VALVPPKSKRDFIAQRTRNGAEVSLHKPTDSPLRGQAGANREENGWLAPFEMTGVEIVPIERQQVKLVRETMAVHWRTKPRFVDSLSIWLSP